MISNIRLRDQNIPAVGLGTWQLKGINCIRSVHFALDLGYRHVDTAQIYENEEEVGEGLKESGIARDKIFLTTKVWIDSFGEGDLQDSVEESLRKLKTDYIDLLLLHWPNEDVELGETLNALMEVQDQGKAKNIGVSNFTLEWLEKAHDISDGRIITNQIEHHPFIPQAPVRDWVWKHDMFVTAYSPLARGKVMNDQALKKIGRKYDKEPSQVALRWATQLGDLAVIPKSGSEEHIQSNFDIFDFDLDAEDMKKITDMAKDDGRLIDPGWAPDWDTAKAA